MGIAGMILLIAAAAAAVFLLGGYLFIRKFILHMEASAEGKRHILCIGDSITFGMGVYKNRQAEAWPYRLNALLGESRQVLNYGISAATLYKGGDHPYKEEFLEAAIKVQGEVYLIMLGTNDSKPYNWNREGYERALLELVNCLRKNVPQAKVLLMTPPRAFPTKNGKIAFDISNDRIHDEISPILRQTAEKEGLGLVDLYALTDNHPEYFDDGVHPNRLGNEAIAQCIFDALTLN